MARYLKSRLTGYFLGLWVVLFGFGVFQSITSLQNLAKLKTEADQLSEQRIIQLARLDEVRATLLKASVSLTDILLASSESDRQESVTRRAKLLDHLVTELKEYEKGLLAGQEQYFRELMESVGTIAGTMAGSQLGRLAGSYEKTMSLTITY